jgi:uncharacterized protein YegP (UPF0339 family)
MKRGFIIFPCLGGYGYRLHNDRGDIVLTGKHSSSRDKCVQCIRELFALCTSDKNYHIEYRNGSFYFQLCNCDGEAIATSRSYRTMAGTAYGIDAVKKLAAVSVIRDSAWHYSC